MEAQKKPARRKSGALDTNAICRIIMVCASAGVSRLRLGELELHFHSAKPAEELSHDEIEASTLEADPLSDALETEDSPKASAGPDKAIPSQNLLDQKILEEMRLDQLALDDPLGFEAQMIDRHFRTEGSIS